MYPTSRWVRDEVVQDYYELDIAPALVPGHYQWAVVVYRVLEDGSFKQLHNTNGDELIIGGTFEIVVK